MYQQERYHMGTRTGFHLMAFFFFFFSMLFMALHVPILAGQPPLVSETPCPAFLALTSRLQASTATWVTVNICFLFSPHPCSRATGCVLTERCLECLV